nr:reverse transcriptase domain-containing protein [Tanacetum cinerariifolium]
VRALLLDKKNQYSAQTPSPTPAPIKAVEPNYVTCGGNHAYQNCPATSGNIYQDNIQEYVSQVAAANYGQGNIGFQPQMVANQIRPPEFPPVQNTQNNFNRGNNFNQNRGGNFNQSNFNQSQLHRPQVNQPLAYQAPTYQAPVSRTQSVSQNDFERYIKANDAVLRNIQNQGQSTQNQCQSTQNQLQTVQNQLANLTDMMSKFMNANTASSLGSGTLPGNTVTNPKEDLKGITTRSGIAYQGPTIPIPSKVAKQITEVTKDQVQTSNSQSTAPVQPTDTQSESETPVSEPIVAPKFYEIFKEMSFEISFMDALMLMRKFASTLKALIGNKEKLSEMARTPMNEHCLAVILNKLPKKLGDPRKFLIPCEFPGMDECLALADLGASINLMPLFVWKRLSLPELTPTCMTLKLADRTESKPVGIAKDVKMRCFLKNKIDVTDEACEEYSQEFLGFSDITVSVSPTPSNDPIVSTTSPTLTPFGDSNFLLFEEADAFLGLEDDPDSLELDPSYYDPEGDILLLESILNSDPSPPFPNHKQYVPSFKEELKAWSKYAKPVPKYSKPVSKSANPNGQFDEHDVQTHDGVAYQGPTILTQSRVVKQGIEVNKDQVQTPSSQSTAPVQPSVIQPETQTLIFEPVVVPVGAPMPNLKSSIPYPSRHGNERRHDQANEQIEKFYKIFKDMSFEISFMDALILMPKFASTLKALIGNKEKLSEMARTPMNKHVNFVVVDFEPDLRVPLILKRCFLKTSRALIDVHKGELTLRIKNEAITYNLDQIVSKPLPPLHNHEQYLPSFKKKLKVCEAKTVKSFVDEPPKVELKDLPSHHEYTFLEGDNKLPVIIAKELGDEEKSALIKVLKPHKRAISWKLSDIQ